MTLEQIKDLRDRTPFRPFRLHQTSGATVAVVSNDHLLFSPDRRQLVLFLPSGAVWVLDPGEVAAAAQSRTETGAPRGVVARPAGAPASPPALHGPNPRDQR